MKEKANRLLNKYYIELHCHKGYYDLETSKVCAIICVKNEYYSSRELLFNLKSSGINISEKVYLSRFQELIDEEKLLIEEIENL